MAIVTKSAFWNNNYNPITQRNQLDPEIGRILNKPGMEATKEILLTLVNGSVGDVAQASHKQVVASTTENGGRRSIETKYAINRATTSDDLAAINAVLSNNMTSAYVPSKSLRA